MPAPLTDVTFRAVVDAAPDAILLIDSRGIIAYANARTEQLFGYAADDLVGERVERLVPPGLRDRHVMNREVYTEHPHTRGMGVGLRLYGAHRDGSLVPLEISLSPYRVDDRVFVVAIARDVTELRRQEDVVKRSEARLRLVTTNAADMIFRYRHRPTPAFEFVSPASTTITGYTPEEFYAHPDLLMGIVHEADREALQETLAASGRRVIAVRGRHRDGAPGWFEYSVHTVIDAAGDPVTEGVLRDVTARREADEERQQLLAAIQTQLERERIAGDLHDDTIQSLYGLGLSLHADLAQSSGAQADVLQRAITSLNAVIADMRAYMHQLGGTHAPEAEPDSLGLRIWALLEGSPVEWDVTVPEESGLDEAGERHLYLLAKELVSNVIRHAEARHASIEVRRGDDAIELEVRDDGVGFDPDDVSTESFGLRSIRHRVQMLDGTLEVETRRGGGCRTRVRVPVLVRAQ